MHSHAHFKYHFGSSQPQIRILVFCAVTFACAIFRMPAKGSKTKASSSLGPSSKKSKVTMSSTALVPLRGVRPPAHVSSDSAFSQDVESPRRRLGRRDSDDKVDRVMTTRLGKSYPAALLEGARNSFGQSIRDVLKLQIRDNKSSKKNLTTAFWTRLASDFSLSSSAADRLPDPVGGESICDELVDKLGFAHSDNPASRTVEPLERFLDECSELSYVECYGILQASMECPLVIRSASVRMLVAFLKYLGRKCGACVVAIGLFGGARNTFCTSLFEHITSFLFRCCFMLYVILFLNFKK